MSSTSSPAEITVTLPDGSQRTAPKGATVGEVAYAIGQRLGQAAIAGRIDGKPPCDIHTPLHQSCHLSIVTLRSEPGLEVLRHSAAHLLASAVQALFPKAKLGTGPATSNGFYYDIDWPGGFSEEDLRAIEQKMRQMVQEDLPLERLVLTREQAAQRLRDREETYKLAILQQIPADETITFYRHGSFEDLCEGPHVPSTKHIPVFTLTHTAGAYWRGDEANPMLTRIYGTAFWSKKEYEAYLAALELAKQRDHRKLGKELQLFSFHPMAPAMPFFHPKGRQLQESLLAFVRQYYHLLDFQEITSPQLFDAALFEQSGHAANYSENMYFCDVEGRSFALKPMSCPGHALYFQQELHSWRDLPLRLAEFGKVHRHERSGVTAGLTRVRSFCQDDAHIFCQEGQIDEEIELQLRMIQDVYAHFGFTMEVALSTRPAKSLGREPELSDEQRRMWDDLWSRAEQLLRAGIVAVGLPYQEQPGDGAFYGPKIDCQVKDALGRWHQLGTIQLDFALPRRFGLHYINTASQQEIPVMLHRAVLGSLERFTGLLLEHTGGDFPLWLAPVQVRILPIQADVEPYASQLLQRLEAVGIRCEIDRRRETLNARIRAAELQKIPVVAVVGAREMEQQQVALRWRKQSGNQVHALDVAVEHVLRAAAMPLPGEVLVQRARQVAELGHSRRS